MSFVEKAKQVVSAIFNTQSYKESAELKYLREIYYNRDGNLKRDQWYRLLNENTDLVGFGFSCLCGAWYQILDAKMWYSAHVCPKCGRDFDLLKSCPGIDEKLPPSKWWQEFQKLPARPRLSNKQTPPFVDTWSSKDEGVGYETYDPGMAGFGVGFGGK